MQHVTDVLDDGRQRRADDLDPDTLAAAGVGTLLHKPVEPQALYARLAECLA